MKTIWRTTYFNEVLLAAGIAAGVVLLENGINNIILLEAEDRIGGGISTVSFGDNHGRIMVSRQGAEYCF